MAVHEICKIFPNPQRLFKFCHVLVVLPSRALQVFVSVLLLPNVMHSWNFANSVVHDVVLLINCFPLAGGVAGRCCKKRESRIPLWRKSDLGPVITGWYLRTGIRAHIIEPYFATVLEQPIPLRLRVFTETTHWST